MDDDGWKMILGHQKFGETPLHQSTPKVCFRPFASPHVREKPRCNNGESRGSGAARSDVAAGGFGTDAHGKGNSDRRDDRIFFREFSGLLVFFFDWRKTW